MHLLLNSSTGIIGDFKNLIMGKKTKYVLIIIFYVTRHNTHLMCSISFFSHCKQNSFLNFHYKNININVYSYLIMLCNIF